MKLTEWASIADVISGIAVIVTLVFLIVEVRDNTEVTRAAAYERSIDSLNEFRMELARDPELYDLFANRGSLPVDGTAAGDASTDRLFSLLNVQWGIYESSYFSNQYGTLGPTEWSRYERLICRNRDQLHPRTWQATQGLLTDEFVTYVAMLCGESQ